MRKTKPTARILAKPSPPAEPESVRVVTAQPLAAALEIIEAEWCGRPVWHCPWPGCQYVNTNQATAREHLTAHIVHAKEG